MGKRETFPIWNWTAFLSGIGLGFVLGWLVKRPIPKLTEYAKSQDSTLTSSVPTGSDYAAPEFAPVPPMPGLGANAAARAARQLDEMRAEYRRLKKRYDYARAEAQDQERVALFRVLEPVLVQLSLIAADHEAGFGVSAADVLGLATTLPRRLQQAEITSFGTIGGQVPFDPRLHKPVPSSAPLSPGDEATIVCPGFLYRDEVLTRAEVKRGSPNSEQYNSN